MKLENNRAIKMEGICKTFGNLIANDHVDFAVTLGEFHALLGENGAGKSTLMHILSGKYKADSGIIELNGHLANIRSPLDALKQKIGMVHQHFQLIDRLSVLENIMLAHSKIYKSTRWRDYISDHFFNNRFQKKVADRIDEIAHTYGLEVDPYAEIWQLSVGERQRVEIVKVLYLNADILILDEPTAVLTPQESDSLFRTLHKLKERGATIIFITHKLREVMLHAQNVTIMRKGRVVGIHAIEDVDEEKLALMMVGDAFKLTALPPSNHVPKNSVLQIEAIRCKGKKGLDALTGLSLELRAGEILGVAGIAGNGQEALAECITGLLKVYSGTISLGEKRDGTFVPSRRIENMSPNQTMDARIAYIPADRLGWAVAPNLSVWENLSLKECRNSNFFLNLKKMKEKAAEYVRQFQIHGGSLHLPARSLSGGNLQKLILAREISSNPDWIVAVYPTRGLDVAATRFIQQTILDLKKQGKGILYISEDLDEIFFISDRIAVLREGNIVFISETKDVTKNEIGLRMLGEHR